MRRKPKIGLIVCLAVLALSGCVKVGLFKPNYCTTRVCLPCIQIPFPSDEMSEVGLGVGYTKGCSAEKFGIFFYEEQFTKTDTDQK